MRLVDSLMERFRLILLKDQKVSLVGSAILCVVARGWVHLQLQVRSINVSCTSSWRIGVTLPCGGLLEDNLRLSALMDGDPLLLASVASSVARCG